VASTSLTSGGGWLRVVTRASVPTLALISGSLNVKMENFRTRFAFNFLAITLFNYLFLLLAESVKLKTNFNKIPGTLAAN
jgi:hypothetical protein